MCNATAIVLVLDAFAWVFNGQQSFAAKIINHTATFISFLFSIWICYLWVWYSASWVFRNHKLNKKIMYVCILPAAVESILVIANLFLGGIYHIDSCNIYHRGNCYFVNTIGYVIYIIAALTVVIYKLCKDKTADEKKHDLVVIILMILPVVGFICQIFVYGLTLIWQLFALSLVILYFKLQSEFETSQQVLVERSKYELVEKDVALMKNQLRPHFLFNALNTIIYLCDTNPEDASKAVIHFAGCLRASIDSLTVKEPVPFEAELENVKNYMSIEVYRFPKISISYKIECTEFKLAPLTLQPIVANAVKHGLFEKQGGVIVLHSYEKDGRCFVTVTDDGVGFDVTRLSEHLTLPDETGKAKQEGSLENIRTRLSWMCGGTLTIESKPGYGTKVTVSVPAEQPEASK